MSTTNRTPHVNVILAIADTTNRVRAARGLWPEHARTADGLTRTTTGFDTVPLAELKHVIACLTDDQIRSLAADTTRVRKYATVRNYLKDLPEKKATGQKPERKTRYYSIQRIATELSDFSVRNAETLRTIATRCPPDDIATAARAVYKTGDVGAIQTLSSQLGDMFLTAGRVGVFTHLDKKLQSRWRELWIGYANGEYGRPELESYNAFDAYLRYATLRDVVGPFEMTGEMVRQTVCALWSYQGMVDLLKNCKPTKEAEVVLDGVADGEDLADLVGYGRTLANAIALLAHWGKPGGIQKIYKAVDWEDDLPNGLHLVEILSFAHANARDLLYKKLAEQPETIRGKDWRQTIDVLAERPEAIVALTWQAREHYCQWASEELVGRALKTIDCDDVEGILHWVPNEPKCAKAVFENVPHGGSILLANRPAGRGIAGALWELVAGELEDELQYRTLLGLVDDFAGTIQQACSMVKAATR